MSDDNDSASLDPAPRCGGGGRRQGIPNYNNRILLPIIEEILPNGSEAWRLVAAAYKEQSGEDNLRLEDDLKRNWVCKLCNNMKKPTGLVRVAIIAPIVVLKFSGRFWTRLLWASLARRPMMTIDLLPLRHLCPCHCLWMEK